jgi:hypothetical protein
MTLGALFEKTVFVLGAGASIDAGCRSSKQMLASLRTEIQENVTDPEKQKQFRAIYDFVMQCLVFQHGLKNPNASIADVTNIEDFVAIIRQIIDREFVIPAPLIANWNNKIIGWEMRNERVFDELLDFIFNCLVNKWVKHDSEKAKELVAPFLELIGQAEAFDLKIISLNYDLVFEGSLNSDRENLVETGFSQGRWHGDFEDPASPAKIKLFKLHGSVDWYFDEDVQEVLCGSYEGQRPAIVFGAGPKMQSFDPYLSLLASARQFMKKADLFVVIGYSFQDKYLNNILIQSLGADLNKKMLVIDPGIDSSPTKFVEKVEEFQKSKSFNELLNFTKKINPERVEILKETAKDFFGNAFKDKAAFLAKKLEDTEAGGSIF